MNQWNQMKRLYKKRKCIEIMFWFVNNAIEARRIARNYFIENRNEKSWLNWYIGSVHSAASKQLMMDSVPFPLHSVDLWNEWMIIRLLLIYHSFTFQRSSNVSLWMSITFSMNRNAIFSWFDKSVRMQAKYLHFRIHLLTTHSSKSQICECK